MENDSSQTETSTIYYLPKLNPKPCLRQSGADATISGHHLQSLKFNKATTRDPKYTPINVEPDRGGSWKTIFLLKGPCQVPS